jgi:hypothetical protein
MRKLTIGLTALLAASLVLVTTSCKHGGSSGPSPVAATTFAGTWNYSGSVLTLTGMTLKCGYTAFSGAESDSFFASITLTNNGGVTLNVRGTFSADASPAIYLTPTSLSTKTDALDESDGNFHDKAWNDSNSPGTWDTFITNVFPKTLGWSFTDDTKPKLKITIAALGLTGTNAVPLSDQSAATDFAGAWSFTGDGSKTAGLTKLNLTIGASAIGDLGSTGYFSGNTDNSFVEEMTVGNNPTVYVAGTFTCTNSKLNLAITHAGTAVNELAPKSEMTDAQWTQLTGVIPTTLPYQFTASDKKSLKIDVTLLGISVTVTK